METAWCTFAFFAPVILVKIFIAPAIDTGNKKKILLNNEIIRALIVFSFIILLYFIKNTNMLLFIIPTSFLFGVFATITEITEPSALKILIKDQDSTSVISTYEIRTRGVQLLAPTVCGILISLSLFSPYVAVLFVSFIIYNSIIIFEFASYYNSKYRAKKLVQKYKRASCMA